MQNRLEKEIERAVVKWAERHNIRALKLNLSGNTGWPDRLFIGHGLMCFIEFKRPGYELRELQKVRFRELTQRGMYVAVFDEYDAAVAFLEATLVPKARDKADDKSGGSGAAPRSGVGQDDNQLSLFQAAP
jgi:hypothetical protein